MRNRFWRRLYTIQEIKLVDGHLRYVTNEDGTLFADIYRTKIKPEDLPEWFLYGRYYTVQKQLISHQIAIVVG